jgi:hypothetical protein
MRDLIVKLLVTVILIIGIPTGIMLLEQKKMPRIDVEQYNKLEVGMTLEETIDILGEGYLDYETASDGYVRQDYIYIEKFKITFKTIYDPREFHLRFINGRLEKKSLLI